MEFQKFWIIWDEVTLSTIVLNVLVILLMVEYFLLWKVWKCLITNVAKKRSYFDHHWKPTNYYGPLYYRPRHDNSEWVSKVLHSWFAGLLYSNFCKVLLYTLLTFKVYNNSKNQKQYCLTFEGVPIVNTRVCQTRKGFP